MTPIACNPTSKRLRRSHSVFSAAVRGALDTRVARTNASILATFSHLCLASDAIGRSV